MIGTAPIFYRIPVTTALLQALATASYPKEETIVIRHIPCVPHQHRYRSDGMRPLENRRIILQYFEAFKSAIVRLLSPCYRMSRVHASFTKRSGERKELWNLVMRDSDGVAGCGP